MGFCKNIAVFCGSSLGADPEYVRAAKQLGALIGRQGRALVFGGCLDGLMAELAWAARNNGATVYSEFVRCLYDASPRLPDSVETLHDNVSDRKRGLIARSDACIMFPGGMGTLDEFTDVCAAVQLGEAARPIGILNIAGYYDPLLDFFANMRKEGFLAPKWDHLFVTSTAPESLLGMLDNL